MDKKTWQILGGVAALGLGVYLWNRNKKSTSGKDSVKDVVDAKESDYTDVIGYGSKGDDVLAIQKYLNTVSRSSVPESGNFDEETLKAVKNVLYTEYVDLPTLKRIKRDLVAAKVI
jgi:peptidoglycan hydrolase-like protein with peptidoglycan-binding domain